MIHKPKAARDTAIDQMVQTVLKDILCSVVDEFEQKTGVQVGSIRLGPSAGQEARTAEIEVVNADGDALIGLMQYKKILCDHEVIKENDFCIKG